MATDAKFDTGQMVRVRPTDHPGHHRTPWYVKGKTGRVDAIYDPWPNPETLAYGGSGLPKVPLYRVEFDQTDLWDTYAGPNHDRLVVDIFEHWLEPYEGESHERS